MASIHEKPRTVLRKRLLRVVLLPFEEGEAGAFSQGLKHYLNTLPHVSLWVYTPQKGAKGTPKQDLTTFLEVKRPDVLLSTGAPPVWLRTLLKNMPAQWVHCGHMPAAKKAIFSWQKPPRMPEKVFTFLKEEAQVLKNQGVDARFIGHPLLNQLPRYKTDQEGKAIYRGRRLAVIPPKGGAAIKQTMPTLAKALHMLKADDPMLEIEIFLNGHKARFFEPYHALGAHYVHEKEAYSRLASCSYGLSCQEEWHLPLLLLEVPFLWVQPAYVQRLAAVCGGVFKQNISHPSAVGEDVPYLPLKTHALFSGAQRLMQDDVLRKRQQIAAQALTQRLSSPLTEDDFFDELNTYLLSVKV